MQFDLLNRTMTDVVSFVVYQLICNYTPPSESQILSFKGKDTDYIWSLSDRSKQTSLNLEPWPPVGYGIVTFR